MAQLVTIIHSYCNVCVQQWYNYSQTLTTRDIINNCNVCVCSTMAQLVTIIHPYNQTHRQRITYLLHAHMKNVKTYLVNIAANCTKAFLCWVDMSHAPHLINSNFYKQRCEMKYCNKLKLCFHHSYKGGCTKACKL